MQNKEVKLSYKIIIFRRFSGLIMYTSYELQSWMNQVESYCKLWNLKCHLSKSDTGFSLVENWVVRKGQSVVIDKLISW
jgi:hypothetical protein